MQSQQTILLQKNISFIKKHSYVNPCGLPLGVNA